MTRQEAEQILQKTFKLPSFYDDQWQTIERILSGDKVLLIEKQGLENLYVINFLPPFLKE